MSPNPDPSTTPSPSSNLPKNATIIFDYRDAPLDPEELAAIQAMKDLRRRTSLKSRRLRKTTSPSTPVGVGPQGLSTPEMPERSEGCERVLREEKPDRLPDPVSLPVEPKHLKGGQPNNTNALKYGFREFCAPKAPERSEERESPERSEEREVPELDTGSGDREGYSSNITRKRGGQPDNTNALKYGFYARRIPQRELDGLDETAVTSLKDEIDVMRVFSRKVAELGADVDDLEEATSLLRVLSLATSSINRLVRTHTRIPDPDLDPALLLRTALLELEEEWPELKAFGDKYRNKPGNPSRDSEDI